MKDSARQLGRRIAERRRQVGLTQEGLAERADVSVKTVQGVEQGRTEPELRTAMRFAEVLGVPLADLVGGPRERRETAAEAVIRQIENDLRHLPLPLVRHVAAVIKALRRAG